MSKYKSDYERLEMVKKFKCSNKTISQFSKDEKIPYTTIRDWIRAFDNIDGEFVKLKKELSKPGVVLENDDATVKLLKMRKFIIETLILLDLIILLLLLSLKKLKLQPL